MNNEPQIKGKIIRTVGKFQVWQTVDNNYIVIGGEYPMLFETMPPATELMLDKACKPYCLLNGYEKFQLEKKGSLLISQQMLINDLSDYKQHWFEQQVLLNELQFETY